MPYGASGDVQLQTKNRILTKIKSGLKFLLFLEQNPKHKVTSLPLWFIMLLPIITLTLSSLLFQILASHGITAFLTTYTLLTITAIEIPHILLDR